MEAAACTSCSAPSFLALRRSRPSHQGTAAAALCSSPFSSSAARLRAASSSFVVDLRLRSPSISIFSPSHQRRPAQRNKPASAVFERFDSRAIDVVVQSQREALALGEVMVSTQHLLLGLVAEDRSPHGFLNSGITVDRAREAVRARWSVKDLASDAMTPPSSLDVPFSTLTKQVIEAAVEYAKGMGSDRIAPEHIVIGLFNADDGTAASVVRSLGANLIDLSWDAFSRLREQLSRRGKEPLTFSILPRRDLPGKRRERAPVKAKKDESLIDHFCVDLTARARKGLIDPVIGRDREIQRILQILCRRTKNNPILLGEAGVGKTAIVQGLALCIVEGDVPSFLKGKRILSLDLGLLIAGTSVRGDLESRVVVIIREAEQSGDTILFVDEAHTLIGTGAVGRENSGLDIANLLKPSLGRGGLQCIAATTLDEYGQFFDKDKALSRRFQPVLIGEPSQEDAVRILLGILDKYEYYHKCRFTREAIDAAVYLSARYLPDRRLPDKAVDLIDEAGSKARMDAFWRKKAALMTVLSESPEEMHEVLKRTIEYYRRKRRADASEDNDTEFSTVSSLNIDERAIVGPEDIAAVVSIWSGIPVQKLNADEKELLLHLDEQLRKRVIGQDDAVGAIARAVKRSRVGVSDPKRPISVMLFCGPTGVGKTELTKALAASYFGSEEAILRLDMSEYMEQLSVSKMVGAPPGYIGFGEGGTLTEAVRRKPYTVVLLDEIEKAHRDTYNILLQVFEDGHLTDSKGRRVSFKNTLIVMTSNLGSEAIARGKRGMGFLLDRDRDSSSKSYAEMKKLVMEELKAFFLPELLNRVDEVVVFRPLERAQMLDILNILLGQVKKRLETLKINVEVSDAMKELACRKGYDRTFGARALRRAVARLVEDPISEAILSGECEAGDTVLLDVDAAGSPVVTRLPDQTSHERDDVPSTL